MKSSTDKATPKAITPEALDKERRQAEAEKWLTVWKPSQFIEFEPPSDFVLVGDCHLTRGGLSVLGGSPGVGKSRAVLGLAIAGATGKDWMGHPIRSRFRTLIIQCENGSFRLKGELTEALDGIDLDAWLRISKPPPRGLAFSELEFQERVRAIVMEFKPGLIVIDPWNRTADGEKQGDYRAALDAVMAAFLSGEGSANGRQVSEAAIAAALEGMAGETKKQAVDRLVNAGVCGKSKAYEIIANHPHIEADSEGKLWWKGGHS